MSKTATSIERRIERLTIACECGAVHVFALGWHDTARAKCGRMYWAIWPRRNGPFELRPWPGPPLTKWEFADKEAHDALRKAEGQPA